MRRTSTLALGAIALALGLAAAGCGGGSKSAATTEQATTATTEAATTTEQTTTTQAATTEAATTTAKASSFSGLSAGKCRDLANVGQKFSNAFTGAGKSGDLKKQAELLKEATKKVPSEIRGDFEVVADYFSKVVDAVGNVKPGQTPSPQALAKLQKLATSIDQTKLQQASKHIAAWVQKNCHA